MPTKHYLHKYGSVALNCLVLLVLVIAITFRTTGQPETKQPLKKEKQQSISPKPKRTSNPAVILPPPPPLKTNLTEPSTKTFLTASPQNFSKSGEQPLKVTKKHPKERRTILKPTTNQAYTRNWRNVRRKQEPNRIIKKIKQKHQTQTVKAARPQPLQTKNLSKGRILLKKLEYGKGPQIEVSWPDQLAQKQKLYLFLNRCFRMRTAGLNASNQLYLASGVSDTPLKLNLDTSSSFIREVHGLMSRAEIEETIRIKRKHPNQSFKSFVRIFSRQVDASLLQGLHSALGSGFSKAKQIKATYRLYKNEVEVREISTGTQKYGTSFRLRKSQQC